MARAAPDNLAAAAGRRQARSVVRPHLAAVLDPRITEHRNPRSASIDLASPLEIVEIINSEDRTVADAVATQKTQIAKAIETTERVFRAGGRLIYAGAGTSGRLGVLDAAECPPTFGVPPEMVQGLIAGGHAALLRAQEGAEDSPEGGARDVDALAIGGNDFLIGIAASGSTPYVQGAIARARERGASTAILACTPPPAAMLSVAHIAIVPITGPEVVTGSTRMKAGTATKLVLNMITTGAMIRIGKTYGNLMVDLKATNAKLRDRSERILVEVCEVDRTEARRLLSESGGSVKTAIVMHALAVSRAKAEDALARAGGVVRRAVSAPPPPVK
jgi:N-acetylmuramic acid 6-phosphate etherase